MRRLHTFPFRTTKLQTALRRQARQWQGRLAGTTRGSSLLRNLDRTNQNSTQAASRLASRQTYPNDCAATRHPRHSRNSSGHGHAEPFGRRLRLIASPQAASSWVQKCSAPKTSKTSFAARIAYLRWCLSGSARRAMTGWAPVEPACVALGDQLAVWLDRLVRFARSSPTKERPEGVTGRNAERKA